MSLQKVRCNASVGPQAAAQFAPTDNAGQKPPCVWDSSFFGAGSAGHTITCKKIYHSEIYLFHNTFCPLQFDLSGLGVPGRRYDLGGYIGVFRFFGRVNHQTHILKVAPHALPTPSAIEFALQHLEGLVLLGRANVVNANRPSDQSPLGNVNNRLLLLRVATKTFDPLPLVCMIKALQSSELRKHSLVRLNDLLLT